MHDHPHGRSPPEHCLQPERFAMPCFCSSTFSRAVSGLFALLVMSGLPNSAPAQTETGTVKGIVQTTNGKPAPGVNVILKDLDRGTTSNEEGQYVLSDVPTGSHTLVVSHVGLETQTRTITVNAGETATVSAFSLAETTEQLNAIVVEARSESYTTESSEYVNKVPMKDINSPQVYNAIPDALLTDQVVTNFEDVMQNAPGAFKLWESTGRGGDGSGYYALRGFATQPKLRNGLPSLTNGSPDPVNIDRVEIPKGPSGTLYGSSVVSAGGLINVVTKKPYSSLGGDISYKTGSFGLNRVTADVNVPIRKEDNLALRVNGAFHSEESFQDSGFKRSFFLAPSLSYEPSDRLSFLVNAEFYTSEKTNPTMIFMARTAKPFASNIDELGYDPDHSFTSNDLTVSNPTVGLQGQMEYKLSEHWTAKTSVSQSTSKSDGNYSFLFENTAKPGNFFRFINEENSTTTNTDLQQNVVGNFDLGITNHRVVVGGGYRQEEIVNNGTGRVVFDQISVGTANPSGLSQAAVEDALAANGTPTRNSTKEERYSAYALDVIDIIPQLSVMGSVRLDHFKQSDSVDDVSDTEISPKFGVVVKPIPGQLSLFGNYMNGFSRPDPEVQDDGTIKTFDPEQANQWEAGVKTRLFNERFTATVSVYDITVSNRKLRDPDRAGDFFIQDGERDSRGIEASATASPIEGLQLIAGYSYNESGITDGKPNIEGRRPEQAGPQNLFNAWMSYRIQDGVLDGVGFGVGANHASSNKILNRDTGTFTLPSYTLFDASVSYERSDYRIDLKVDNLTDETYYKGWTTINPQAPRTVKANVTYTF